MVYSNSEQVPLSIFHHCVNYVNVLPQLNSQSISQPKHMYIIMSLRCSQTSVKQANDICRLTVINCLVSQAAYQSTEA